MPFVSQAQRAFMYANHPSIAKRWEQVTPKDHKLAARKLNAKTESHEVWRKGVDHTKRQGGVKRDFKALRPNEVQRHKPKAASEAEAMNEGQGIAFQHGSRHTELGKPAGLERFHRRDAFQATKMLPGVKNG